VLAFTAINQQII